MCEKGEKRAEHRRPERGIPTGTRKANVSSSGPLFRRSINVSLSLSLSARLGVRGRSASFVVDRTPVAGCSCGSLSRDDVDDDDDDDGDYDEQRSLAVRTQCAPGCCRSLRKKGEARYIEEARKRER